MKGSSLRRWQYLQSKRIVNKQIGKFQDSNNLTSESSPSQSVATVVASSPTSYLGRTESSSSHQPPWIPVSNWQGHVRLVKDTTQHIWVLGKKNIKQ